MPKAGDLSKKLENLENNIMAAEDELFVQLEKLLRDIEKYKIAQYSPIYFVYGTKIPKEVYFTPASSYFYKALFKQHIADKNLLEAVVEFLIAYQDILKKHNLQASKITEYKKLNKNWHGDYIVLQKKSRKQVNKEKLEQFLEEQAGVKELIGDVVETLDIRLFAGVAEEIIAYALHRLIKSKFYSKDKLLDFIRNVILQYPDVSKYINSSYNIHFRLGGKKQQITVLPDKTKQSFYLLKESLRQMQPQQLRFEPLKLAEWMEAMRKQNFQASFTWNALGMAQQGIIPPLFTIDYLKKNIFLPVMKYYAVTQFKLHNTIDLPIPFVIRENINLSVSLSRIARTLKEREGLDFMEENEQINSVVIPSPSEVQQVLSIILQYLQEKQTNETADVLKSITEDDEEEFFDVV